MPNLKNDVRGERTIGVLTKLDNLNSSTDKKRVVDILENQTKPLKLGGILFNRIHRITSLNSGYVGVVNRSQEDIDDEKEFDNTSGTVAKVLREGCKKKKKKMGNFPHLGGGGGKPGSIFHILQKMFKWLLEA